MQKMLTMNKRIFLVLCILGMICPSFANNLVSRDELPILATNEGNEKTEVISSISASIDGHSLTIIFLANLGQVTIKVLDELDVEIELMSTPTPTGQIIYIPLAGRYTVLFTLSNGDVYYGEFEVVD